ncbi:mediator of RNA polymerase II transcription subunit 29 isoform X1 [Eschrichtius robustus]|uniref:mediator of RNA polymerase II transcription subunit 29 isoform X1 n=1 Tax=Eschrichtius robustus TaxID=9764 RepID=UPI0035C23D64
MAASQQQASAASSATSVSGPGSAGGSGPQQQPQPPTQLVGPAQSGLLQQQQQDFDPVQRYKMLIPQLKESLQTLMKVAAQNLIQNTNIDNGQKSSDGPIQRFDKCLEEFYALCDQLELCLEETDAERSSRLPEVTQRVAGPGSDPKTPGFQRLKRLPQAGPWGGVGSTRSEG